MGREIRLVPPPSIWQHPKTTRPNHRLGIMEECYQPLRSMGVESAWENWWEEFDKWNDGEGDRIRAEYGDTDYPKDEPYRSFCAWYGPPPDPQYYRPRWPEGSATWVCVYETVSEGTPVSPPFATKKELVDYLVANGDFWDQSRRKERDAGGYMVGMSCDPWDRKAAEAFVNGGWSPSMMINSAGVFTAKDPEMYNK